MDPFERFLIPDSRRKSNPPLILHVPQSPSTISLTPSRSSPIEIRSDIEWFILIFPWLIIRLLSIATDVPSIRVLGVLLILLWHAIRRRRLGGRALLLILILVLIILGEAGGHCELLGPMFSCLCIVYMGGKRLLHTRNSYADASESCYRYTMVVR